MNPVLVDTAVAVTLAVASMFDLKNHAVHDRVFIAGSAAAITLGLLIGPGTAGAMTVQAIILGLMGVVIKAVKTFGGADIWALGVSGLAFPDTLAFTVAAAVLVGMLAWGRVYQIFTRSRYVPAIPGMTAGYLVLLAA